MAVDLLTGGGGAGKDQVKREKKFKGRKIREGLVMSSPLPLILSLSSLFFCLSVAVALAGY